MQKLKMASIRNYKVIFHIWETNDELFFLIIRNCGLCKKVPHKILKNLPNLTDSLAITRKNQFGTHYS